PEEFDILASGGASVVHCPSCNLKLSSGVAPIASYLEHGVNVALGADGAASNNRLDGWEELRLAGLLARFRDGAAAVPAPGLFAFSEQEAIDDALTQRELVVARAGLANTSPA